MKVLVILLMLFSITSNASVPDMDVENIKYMITADNWSENQIFKLRKFILLGRKDLNIFADPEFKKISFKVIKKSKSFVSIETKCEATVPNNVLGFDPLTEATYECGYQYCEKLKSKENITKNLFVSPVQYQDKNSKACEVPFILSRFNYETKNSRDISGTTYNEIFIPIEKFEPNSVATIRWENKSYYISLKECRDEDGCEVYDETEDLWTHQWNALQELREKKSLDSLNFLIENLLPCVKKKDIKCVQKFFATKSDYQTVLGDFERYGGEHNVVINDEILSELEQCLKYESLMPHLRSLKGNNKVCIPLRPLNYSEKDYIPKIGTISLPEAVRVLISNDIIFIRR